MQAGGDRKLVRTDSRAQTLDRFMRPSPRSASGGSPSARAFSPSAGGASPAHRTSPTPFGAALSPGGGGGGAAPISTGNLSRLGPSPGSGSGGGGAPSPTGNPSRLGPSHAGGSAPGGLSAGGTAPVVGSAAAASAAAAAAAGAPARRRGLVRPRDALEGFGGGAEGGDAGDADGWADLGPGDEGALEALAGLESGVGLVQGSHERGRAVRPRLAPPMCKLDSVLELLAEVDKGAHRGVACASHCMD